MSLVLAGLSRVGLGLWDFLVQQLTTLGVVIWDLGLTLYNTIAGDRPRGQFIAAGLPGHGGVWPEFVPPKEGDSRSCCPALNALSNHGILPHDGKNITFPQMNKAIRETYNFAPSFCFFVPDYTAKMLSRSYFKDTIDLSDLNVHNGIEHDASLVRHDVVIEPDQSKPAIDLIDRLLSLTSGPNNTMTKKDLSKFSAIRRAESKATNGQFTLSTFHKMFGSSNSSTMLTIFGGKKDDLEVMLKEERIPDGWEPRILKPYGLTIASFNATVLQVEFGIDLYADQLKRKKQQ